MHWTVPPGALKCVLQRIALHYTDQSIALLIALHCTALCRGVQFRRWCTVVQPRRSAGREEREREREPPLQWVSNLWGVTTTTTTATPQDFKKSNLRGVAINNNNKTKPSTWQALSLLVYLFYFEEYQGCSSEYQLKKIFEQNNESNTLAAEKSPLTFLTIQVAIKSKQALRSST